MEKGNKRVINAWAFYDWANSVYPLVINTAVFPIYYDIVAGDTVRFMGIEWKSASLYSFTIGMSYLIVSIVTPFLSGIADYSGKKKFFMQLFCYIGALSCAGLYLFSLQSLGLGLFFVMMASVGWAGSIVFYNAYLPEIADPRDHDRISAKGYSFGYVGSVLLLIFNLVMIMMPELFFGVAQKAQQLMSENPSLSEELALVKATEYYQLMGFKISFLTVGVWWIGFAQITFRNLPKGLPAKSSEGNLFLHGFHELKSVWIELQDLAVIKRFLLSFFIYSMGVQTVMLMATLFGSQEVEMEQAELIITVLLIQLVAIPGAYGFSTLSKRMGNFKALQVALIIWVGICLAAYFVHVANEFFILAGVVGLVMGGIQSLSRSTYSKLLPKTRDHASYFSFYDVCEKVGVVIGMFSFGYVVQLVGSMRDSVFVIGTYFVLGLAILLLMPKKKK